VLPAIIGVFLGAPLLAREFEHGTLRFAWTQGVMPSSWLRSRLLVLAAAVTAVTVTIALIASWWIFPYERAGLASRWLPGGFLLGPPILAAWSLCMLSVGVLTGALLRRSGRAMALTVVSFVVLANVASAALGGLLSLAPLVTRGSPAGQGSGAVAAQHGFWDAGPRLTTPLASPAGQGPAGSWVVSGWYTNDGYRLPADDARTVTSSIRSLRVQPRQLSQWLAQRHLVHWVSYQPASRFWIFQGAAAVCLLTLTALAVAATIWLVSRRVA
jgi:ABC-type transport system involved in multi-copper enzyme maturation permease subunit